MGIIIVMALVAIIALCGLGYLIFGREGRVYGAAIFGLFAIIELIVIFASIFVTVGTSDVGVLTAFGKTAGDLTPGVHAVAPWDSVTTWDDSVQDITYSRQNCLQVRIGDQQTACLALTLQYQVRPSAVDALFRKYRTQSNMEILLVQRELDQVVNDQLASFSPIQAVAAGDASGASLVPYEASVQKQMSADIGNDIEVESVFMPYPSYDSATTSRLNSLQGQIVDTTIATEAVKTAEQQALALKDLQEATASSPNAIAEQCFTNVMIPIVKAGGDPAGINCWDTAGSGSNVVITKGS